MGTRTRRFAFALASPVLAAAVLASGKPTVTLALRTPWDLLAYPSARTHVCSYGILAPSMEALAAALALEGASLPRIVAIAWHRDRYRSAAADARAPGWGRVATMRWSNGVR